MLNWFLYFIIGYITLFIVVWLHEVGHSFFYWCFGCKKNFLHVTVKPYIFFSTPAPIDEEKEKDLSDIQEIIISYGGVLVNAIFVIASGLLILFLNITNSYILFALWLFMTLHFAEIVSYMFIGDIYPVSDMANIAELCPNLRWVNLIIGFILTVIYAFILTAVPAPIKLDILILNIAVIACMCGGRIVFTIKNIKQQ